jgi:hypothetical protein
MSMGGMGGPSDAWGSPYALYAPQSLAGAANERRETDVAPADHSPCHGDRACKRSSKPRRARK